jgi:hypothetical protein
MIFLSAIIQSRRSVEMMARLRKFGGRRSTSDGTMIGFAGLMTSYLEAASTLGIRKGLRSSALLRKAVEQHPQDYP